MLQNINENQLTQVVQALKKGQKPIEADSHFRT